MHYDGLCMITICAITMSTVLLYSTATWETSKLSKGLLAQEPAQSCPSLIPLAGHRMAQCPSPTRLPAPAARLAFAAAIVWPAVGFIAARSIRTVAAAWPAITATAAVWPVSPRHAPLLSGLPLATACHHMACPSLTSVARVVCSPLPALCRRRPAPLATPCRWWSP
jgi:hypothetical protein